MYKEVNKMISNVNFNTSANVQNVNKLPDEKLRSGSNSAAEITGSNNDTSVVDVFTVSFWERGVPKPEVSNGEVAKSVDITLE